MNSPLKLLVWGFQRCPPSPLPPSFLLPRPSISCLSGFSAHCFPYLPSFCSSPSIPQPCLFEMAYCWWSAWPTEPAYVSPAHFAMSSGDVWDVWRPEDLVWRLEDPEDVWRPEDLAEKSSSADDSGLGTMAPWLRMAPWRAKRATASGTMEGIAEKSSSAIGSPTQDDPTSNPGMDCVGEEVVIGGNKAEPKIDNVKPRILPSQASSSSQSAARALIQGNLRRGSGVKRASGRYGARGGLANPNVQWHTMRAAAVREGWIDEFRRTYPKPDRMQVTKK